MRAFFQEAAYLPGEREILVSERFRQEDGPALWRIRALREEELTADVEEEQYAGLCAAAVCAPDLSDRKLWESYGADSKEELLQRMLTPGEYLRLLEAVLELNGYRERKQERKETAKNSFGRA
ncbi:phage tail assembly chaperone [Anaerotignum lactatifermentans]|nr:hypothetical protein [Anaerotignum lactatifermentans]